MVFSVNINDRADVLRSSIYCFQFNLNLIVMLTRVFAAMVPSLGLHSQLLLRE